jgi:hypothetical protein
MTSPATRASSAARLTVDESRIHDRLWHAVDLDCLGMRLLSGPPRPAPISACLAGALLHQPTRREAPDRAGALIPMVLRKRVKRVPDEAFVTIGRAAVEPVTANDNQPPRPSPARIRFALRDALMLAALAASLAGAFYSGRLHAAQNVIVVPTASTMRNVIT